MAWTFNSFTGKFDYYEPDMFQGVLAAEPSSPQQGWTYISSVTNNFYIYYGTQWQVLAGLTTTATTGSTGSPMGLLLSLTYPS